MHDEILVPTDGSPSADAAMAHAVEIAARDDARIHVLHVIDTVSFDVSIQSARDPLEREGNEYLESHAETAREAGVDVVTAIEDGRPARRILGYVEDHDIDVVVMGARGHGDLEHRFLGSVTDYVVRHSSVPVYTVPNP
ncbi:universal stress protein [Haloarculaceae archaeon H-GB2-1]|nr:universal stress protein [Haloarculaceae archaeon H-GB1-1]MEA5387392.1 universal stress protein [Haloarculaceae archaeon H-GB11]MEA5408866.1 universal stress protein [Haloarculaceae archaeon H-GB2-1]